MKCYCGSSGDFSDCCQPFINRTLVPESAEQLMRSRYSAFNDKQVDYLVTTHWPVDLSSESVIQNTINNTQWLGLKIIRCEAGEVNDQQGTVEFIAFFNEGGVQQLHEKSRFIKVNDRWFYTDGDTLPPVKIGRNDPCFCPSGKKYKKCHGQ